MGEIIILIVIIAVAIWIIKKTLTATVGIFYLLGVFLKKLLFVIFLGPALLISAILHDVTKVIHLQWLFYPVLCIFSPLSLIYACCVNIPYSRKEKKSGSKELFAEKKQERLIALAMPPFIAAVGFVFLFLGDACEDENVSVLFFLIAFVYLIVSVVFTFYKIYQWKKDNASFYKDAVSQKSNKELVVKKTTISKSLIERKKKYHPTFAEWRNGVSEKGIQKKKTKAITLPNGLVDEADYGRFRDFKKLESVTLLDGITKIGAEAFYGCENLVSLKMPKDLVKIEKGAFEGCTKLSDIVFDGTMEQWKNVAGKQNLIFAVPAASVKCSDGEVEKSNLIITHGTVEYCDKSATEITIPAGVIKIGEEAFRDCASLSRITLPEGLKEIGNEAFFGCSLLSSIFIPESILRIGKNSFTGCENDLAVLFGGSERLWNVIRKSAYWRSGTSAQVQFAKTDTVVQNPLVIENSILKHCDELAQTVKVPESVNEIEAGTFSGCRFLMSVIIPDSVQKIRNGAFSHSHISKIIFEGTKEQWEQIAREVKHIPEVIFAPYRNAEQKRFCALLGEL